MGLSPKAYQGNDNYVFVSYAHKDKYRVLPAIEAMQKAGYNVWYDEGIEAGTEWPAYIADRLKGASLVFAFVSKNSVQSENCAEEIYYARANKKKMLIIYLEEVTLPSGLEMRISLMQALFAYKHSSGQSFFNELVASRIVKETLVPSAQGSSPVKPITISKEDDEKKKFSEAQKLFNSGSLEEAAKRFMEIGTTDALMYVYSCAYKSFLKKEYEKALKILERIENYKSGTCNAKELIAKCEEEILNIERDKLYTQAVLLMKKMEYSKAIEMFLPLVKYRADAAANICDMANKYYSMHKYDQALETYCLLLEEAGKVNFFGKEKAQERVYSRAQEYKEQWKKDKSVETLKKTVEYFGKAFGYKDAQIEFKGLVEKLAIDAYKRGDYEQAIDWFARVGYSETKDKYMEKMIKGYEFDSFWSHLVGVTTRKKAYVLPYNVTRISKSAFKSDETITEIKGNAKLMGIEREAFHWCDSLKTVDLSETKVKFIEGYTFAYCKKLTTLIMPKIGNPEIEDDTVFYQCDNLKVIITASGKEMPLEEYMKKYIKK